MNKVENGRPIWTVAPLW